MAKYDVAHTCGHTETHNIIGPTADRDGKLAWLGERVCSDCRDAQRKAEAAATQAAQAKEVAHLELPELTGSPKQIAWATTIRNSVLAQAETMLRVGSERMSAGTDIPENIRLSWAEFVKAVSIMRAQAAAKWWIDRAADKSMTKTVSGLIGRRAEGGKVPLSVADDAQAALRAWGNRRPGDQA